MKIFICVRLTIFSAKKKSVLIIYWVPHKVYKVFVRQVFKYFNMFKALKYVYISTPIAKNKNYSNHSQVLSTFIFWYSENKKTLWSLVMSWHTLPTCVMCCNSIAAGIIRKSHSCIQSKLDCMVRFTGAQQLYKQLMQWF